MAPLAQWGSGEDIRIRGKHLGKTHEGDDPFPLEMISEIPIRLLALTDRS